MRRLTLPAPGMHPGRGVANTLLAIVVLAVTVASMAVGDATAQLANESPRVTNVVVHVDAVAQRVTVGFDLDDAEQHDMQVSLRVANGGMFAVPVGGLQGDVGFPVGPGARTIVWEYDPASLDTSQPLRVKVVADDNQPVDVQALVDAVDAARLRADIETMQGVRHYSSGRSKILATKDYIESQFESHGLEASRQAFRFSSWTAENIIGRHAGALEEDVVFIIDGHFDTVSSTPGADDNASGTAGMLEAMRVLSRDSFRKTVKFIGFDLEEAGIVGSRHYAQNIPDGERIEGLFNFEMIGYTCHVASCDAFRATGNYIHSIGDANSTALRLAFDAAAKQYAPDLVVSSMPGDPSDPNLRRSDHIGFWDRGIPALFLTDGANFRNPHYHRTTDTVETLDFDFMANIVKTTVATVAQLAEIGHLGVGVSEEFSIPDPTAVEPSLWGEVKDRFH